MLPTLELLLDLWHFNQPNNQEADSDGSSDDELSDDDEAVEWSESSRAFATSFVLALIASSSVPVIQAARLEVESGVNGTALCLDNDKALNFRHLGQEDDGGHIYTQPTTYESEELSFDELKAFAIQQFEGKKAATAEEVQSNLKWLIAKKEDPEAYLMLGKLYYHGYLCELEQNDKNFVFPNTNLQLKKISVTSMLRYLKQAAEYDKVEALAILTTIIEEFPIHIPYAEAVTIVKKLQALKPHSHATYLLDNFLVSNKKSNGLTQSENEKLKKLFADFKKDIQKKFPDTKSLKFQTFASCFTINEQDTHTLYKLGLLYLRPNKLGLNENRELGVFFIYAAYRGGNREASARVVEEKLHAGHEEARKNLLSSLHPPTVITAVNTLIKSRQHFHAWKLLNYFLRSEISSNLKDEHYFYFYAHALDSLHLLVTNHLEYLEESKKLCHELADGTSNLLAKEMFIILHLTNGYYEAIPREVRQFKNELATMPGMHLSIAIYDFAQYLYYLSASKDDYNTLLSLKKIRNNLIDVLSGIDMKHRHFLSTYLAYQALVWIAEQEGDITRVISYLEKMQSPIFGISNNTPWMEQQMYNLEIFARLNKRKADVPNDLLLQLKAKSAVIRGNSAQKDWLETVIEGIESGNIASIWRLAIYSQEIEFFFYDRNMAYAWHQVARENGLFISSYHLSILETDVVKAHEYFMESFSQGFPVAVYTYIYRQLDVLDDMLSASEYDSLQIDSVLEDIIKEMKKFDRKSHANTLPPEFEITELRDKVSKKKEVVAKYKSRMVEQKPNMHSEQDNKVTSPSTQGRYFSAITFWKKTIGMVLLIMMYMLASFYRKRPESSFISQHAQSEPELILERKKKENVAVEIVKIKLSNNSTPQPDLVADINLKSSSSSSTAEMFSCFSTNPAQNVAPLRKEVWSRIRQLGETNKEWAEQIKNLGQSVDNSSESCTSKEKITQKLIDLLGFAAALKDKNRKSEKESEVGESSAISPSL